MRIKLQFFGMVLAAAACTAAFFLFVPKIDMQTDFPKRAPSQISLGALDIPSELLELHALSDDSALFIRTKWNSSAEELDIPVSSADMVPQKFHFGEKILSWRFEDTETHARTGLSRAFMRNAFTGFGRKPHIGAINSTDAGKVHFSVSNMADGKSVLDKILPLDFVIFSRVKMQVAVSGFPLRPIVVETSGSESVDAKLSDRISELCNALNDGVYIATFEP